MTNREWLIKELILASDEKLALLFLENNPTCSDDYGWIDRYTNPFNRRYETYQREGFFGKMEDHTEKIFYEDYDKAVKDFVIWLNEEHKEG